VNLHADQNPDAAAFPGIFVFCLPRTGSTLLRLILDSHPEIYCPDEVRLGHVVRALYHANEGLHECVADPASGEQAAPENVAIVETRRMVCELMGAAAQRQGKTLWCEKSPGNLGNMKLIASVLPDARYLLLHRHCLDMTLSCLRQSTYGFHLAVVEDYVRKDHKDFVGAVILAWVEKTAELLRFEGEHGERCHRLRYEDLVAAAEESVNRLCEFLRVPFSPSLLAGVFSSPRYQRQGCGDAAVRYSQGIVDSSIGSGTELGPALSRVPWDLLQRMNELLTRLGYPAVERTADGFDMRLGRRREEEPTGPPSPAVADVFAAIAERLRLDPALAPRVGQSFKFVLSGAGGGTWVLDLTAAPGSVISGDAPAAVTITGSARDFSSVLSGTLNPIVAIKQGRLRLEGQVDEGALQQLFFGLIGN
jgi:protein-tyrosine sulfotransferase